MEIYAVPMVGVYGFTSKASVLVKIPYVNKELRMANTPDRGVNGLGDMTILGKYRVK